MVTDGSSDRRGITTKKAVSEREALNAFAFACISAMRAGMFDDILSMFHVTIMERRVAIQEMARKRRDNGG